MKINIVLNKNTQDEEEVREERRKKVFRRIIKNVILFQLSYLLFIFFSELIPYRCIRFAVQNYFFGLFLICPYWFFCDAFYVLHILKERTIEEINKL